MLVKLGVDISKLEYFTRKSLKYVEIAWEDMGFEEAVITSTFEGNHGVSSFHYQNKAYDLRLPCNAEEKKDKLVRLLKKYFVNGLGEIGKYFDVVLESNHIHVEYDVRK
jgi:hypothetical protein